MPNQPKSISLWRGGRFDRHRTLDRHKASVKFRRLGLVASPMIGRNSVRIKQNAAILALAGASEKTPQFIKTFAGLS